MSFKITKLHRVVRILVNINVREGLFEKIHLSWGNTFFKQRLDYENIPFRCHRCHTYGHLAVECSLGVRMINGHGSQKGSRGNGSSRGTSSSTLGPLLSEPEEGLMEGENSRPPMREDALISRAQDEEDGAAIIPDVGALSSGTSSFVPSPSLNMFTNIFNIDGMDWMGNKLKNLSISPLPLASTIVLFAAHDEAIVSPLPLVASTHSFDTIVEQVFPSSSVPTLLENGSLSSHSFPDSGYCIR